MSPPPTAPRPPTQRSAASERWGTFAGYATRRAGAELRRPVVWIGVALALLLAWAGTHLEILQFDDRPERAWGLALSTAETLALLVVLASRLRGADLSGAEGWSDALRASSLGHRGLTLAETVGAAAAAWAAGAVAASLVLVLSIHSPPQVDSVVLWGASLFVELAVLAAWLAGAAQWIGRLPGLGIAVGVAVLGRTGVGGALSGMWPNPAPIPPEAAAPASLAAGLAACVGLTTLATWTRPQGRTLD